MSPLTNIPVAALLLLLLAALPREAVGQINTYQEANRYFEQQNFEEALPLFEELLQNNPRSLIFFERYIDSLAGLRRYEEAIEVAEYYAGRDSFALQASVKLSELHHLSGQRELAVNRWLEDARANVLNMQAIYYIGNAATERGEYETAIRIYEMANEALGDETLFLGEIANNYMLAGDFENSVEVYFRLITDSPDQMPFVQQRFLRMRDRNLYEIASFELEEVLAKLDYTHAAYSQMYQLLIWLLIETEEYNRAYHVARQFENSTPYDIYSLFTLGHQLRSSHQFEIAVQSYEYYLESPTSSLQPRALEELGHTYREWALYAMQNQLLDAGSLQELNRNAYRMYEELITEYPDYERLSPVLASMIDLSLDGFRDAELAGRWFKKLQDSDPGENLDFINYTEGRIALFNRQFPLARQLLTRADRAADDSNLSEKARYYLALSDLFAGDYEFAEIQLRSLEKRTTSYYANEAIKMRMWISSGLRADSTGGYLEGISRGLFALHTGEFEEAFLELEPVISESWSPLGDDMIVELKKMAPPPYYPAIFSRIEKLIEEQTESPLRERLIWDAISLAIYFREPAGPSAESDTDEQNETEGRSPGPEFNDTAPGPEQAAEWIEVYSEMLLMEFPDGFYAPYVREMLRNQPEFAI